MIEITFGQDIEEEIKATQELIRDEQTYGKNSSESLYGLVTREFSAGKRNTSAQIHYLEAYENALAVFRASSRAVRKEMDILTLEQRVAAQQRLEQQLSATMPADKNDGELQLQREITDAIFFSNRYALAFAGNIGLAFLNAQKADIKNVFSFGKANDASTNRDMLTRRLARTACTDIALLSEVKKKAGETLTDNDLGYTLEGIFTSWINQFSWETFRNIAKARGLEDLTIKYNSRASPG